MAEPRRERFVWIVTIVISVSILGAGAGLVRLIFSTEPAAVQEGATKQTAMLVEVTPVEFGTFRPVITAMGTVRPSRRIVLRPRVGGEIIEISEDFTPGGMVAKGDLMVRIDPADYENTLRQRQSEYRQAVADLQIEMGQQNVAEKEYELFGGDLAGDNHGLVLRKPQLDRARARVEAARAAVDLASLELDRTRVVAPFDAHVLSQEVNLGSQVSAGDPLGTLVGLDTYWVEAMVPISQLRWLPSPGAAEGEVPEVRVRNRTAWPAGEYRSGSIYRVIGELEEESRLARVLVEVEDPFARESPDLPALIIGSYVEMRMPCKPVSDVIRLDREYLRKNDTVWVHEEGKLAIRPVEVRFQGTRHAYISDGLHPDDLVVTTNLATVVDGAPLRMRGSGADPGPGGPSPE